MGQTFDIRFARSAGLAAMLEVPENAFRWKGDGLLRIDAHGISISVKRGLLALFGGKRTQRIPTENLRAVYREGDALRVEFQDGETPRVVLPFWADDRETAANIVRLLPTSETVEMEDSTEAARSGRPRADWRMLWTLTAVLAAVLAAIAAGMWTFYPQSDTPVAAPLASVGERAADLDAVGAMPMPDATAALAESPDSPLAQATPPVTAPAAAPQVSNPESAVPDFLEPPPVILPPLPPLPLPHDYVRSGDFVIPIARGTAAHDVAKAELAVFERETIQLAHTRRSCSEAW
jgi:hypothetical protein